MTNDLQKLLNETKRLRERFEQTQPNSARLPILMRDERRLMAMIGGAA